MTTSANGLTFFDYLKSADDWESLAWLMDLAAIGLKVSDRPDLGEAMAVKADGAREISEKLRAAQFDPEVITQAGGLQ